MLAFEAYKWNAFDKTRFRIFLNLWHHPFSNVSFGAIGVELRWRNFLQKSSINNISGLRGFKKFLWCISLQAKKFFFLLSGKNWNIFFLFLFFYGPPYLNRLIWNKILYFFSPLASPSSQHTLSAIDTKLVYYDVNTTNKDLEINWNSKYVVLNHIYRSFTTCLVFLPLHITGFITQPQQRESFKLPHVHPYSYMHAYLHGTLCFAYPKPYNILEVDEWGSDKIYGFLSRVLFRIFGRWKKDTLVGKRTSGPTFR